MAKAEIKDLIPGKTYRVQVRAVNDNGEYSEWSTSQIVAVPNNITYTSTGISHPILAMSGNGAVVSIGFSTTHPFTVGNVITITGSSNSSFNLKNVVVASVTSVTGITVISAVSGSSTGGTATRNYNVSNQDLFLLYNTSVGDPSATVSNSGLLKSSNFDGTLGAGGNIVPGSEGNTGWAIDYAGYGVFNNVFVRGNITAASGTIGTNPYKWYIGNEYEGIDDAHGVIATWNHALGGELPDVGAPGIELDSEGYIALYGPYSTGHQILAIQSGSLGDYSAGISYRTTTGSVGTSIPFSGNIVFRGISGDTLNNAQVVVSSTNTSVTALGDRGTLSIDNGVNLIDGAGTGTRYLLGFSASSGGSRIQASQAPVTSGTTGTWVEDNIQINPYGGTINLGSSASASPTTLWGKTNVKAAGDVSLSTGGYSLAVGDTSAVHMRLDGNEIQVVDGATGLAGPININNNGSGLSGQINLGGGSSTAYSHIKSYGVFNFTPSSSGRLAVYIQNFSNGDEYKIGSISSSLRYKQDVKPIECDLSKILEMTPVEFRWKSEVASFGDSAGTDIGFIAEQAEELGLTHLYMVDEEGKPEAIFYERIPVYLFQVVKNQQEQIKSLETRLAALENK